MSSVIDQAPSEEAIAPLNFIYACSVCCASFADVYKSRDETVQGLSDGINPKERLVTRLFLASCCHVFCAEHVKDGNPAFHPVGQRPKASCPVCVKEKDDSEPRDLYSVRGFTKDEYDPHIPAAWFTTPPIRLDGNGKEMDALRFQYLALIRYCQNTYANQKTLHNAMSEVEKNKANMEDLASENHAKLLNLQQEHEQVIAKQEQLHSMKAEVRRLQRVEEEIEHYRRMNVNPRDLETFVNNKAAIRHYLKLVPMLIEQNDKMKRRLASLGFAMALEPVPNFKDIDPNVFDSDDAELGNYSGEHRAMLRKTTSSHTVGRSANNSGMATALPSSPFSQRPVKRPRVESPLHGNMQIAPPPSRDVMPPPPKPLSRMQSVRKIFPSWRKKISNGRSTPTSADTFHGNSGIHMYKADNGQDVDGGRPLTRSRRRSEAPLMSGALPSEQLMQASNTPKSQILSSVGMNKSDPDFTFRAPSPLKMKKTSNGHQPVQLPTEPSYMRLMDGLSRDAALELGLKDPRKGTSAGYYNSGRNEQNMEIYEDQQPCQDRDSPTRWSLGHPFLHQAPSGPPSLANVQLDPPRFNPTYSSPRRTETPAKGLITPEHRRHQVSGYPESVVSPFFESSHHQAPLQARAGFAESQDSLRRFGTSQSHSVKMDGAQAGWHRPPSLNGLSFFDSPVNSLNQPVPYSHGWKGMEPMSSFRYYPKRRFEPEGYIVNPDVALSTRVGLSGYDISPPSRRRMVHSQSTYAVPSFQRSNYTRSYQLPSAMPSAVPDRFPIRERQWDALQRAGMRSSRHVFSSETMDQRNSPVKTRSYAAGRRNFRR